MYFGVVWTQTGEKDGEISFTPSLVSLLASKLTASRLVATLHENRCLLV